MMYLMIMRGHVPVWRIVTTQGYAAGLASTQMQPCAVYFDTLLAHIGFGSFDVGDRTEVFA